ncbi:MAG: hypothetical protein LQ340_008047, partial [Diploschistes diacapsis]
MGPAPAPAPVPVGTEAGTEGDATAKVPLHIREVSVALAGSVAPSLSSSFVAPSTADDVFVSGTLSVGPVQPQAQFQAHVQTQVQAQAQAQPSIPTRDKKHTRPAVPTEREATLSPVKKSINPPSPNLDQTHHPLPLPLLAHKVGSLENLRSRMRLGLSADASAGADDDTAAKNKMMK